MVRSLELGMWRRTMRNLETRWGLGFRVSAAALGLWPSISQTLVLSREAAALPSPTTCGVVPLAEVVAGRLGELE